MTLHTEWITSEDDSSEIELSYYDAPKVTLISIPQFFHPDHLAVEFQDDLSLVIGSQQLAEYAGRICYMSQANPAKRTTAEYLSNILQQGHGSVLEHVNVSMLIEGVSRSLTHELVRHRAGWAYSQLSQRYVNLSDTAFVMPPAFIDVPEAAEPWKYAMANCLVEYGVLTNTMLASLQHIEDKVLRRKMARESARSVLPNATETKIVATANIRAWRHFLAMRGSIHADQEIRRLAYNCCLELKHTVPDFFPDVAENPATYEVTLQYPKV